MALTFIFLLYNKSLVCVFIIYLVTNKPTTIVTCFYFMPILLLSVKIAVRRSIRPSCNLKIVCKLKTDLNVILNFSYATSKKSQRLDVTVIVTNARQLVSPVINSPFTYQLV